MKDFDLQAFIEGEHNKSSFLSTYHLPFQRTLWTSLNWEEFPKKIAMIDTHPTLHVPEMMRIFNDMEGLPWQISEIITQKNNDITQKNKGIHKSYRVSRRIGEVTFELMQKLLPRHVKIIKKS